jgi:hypothetical protein
VCGRGIVGALLVLVPGPAASPASAQIRVAEWSGGALELTGYVQTFTGAWRAPGDLAPEDGSDPWEGIHAGVARLAWTARLGERVVVEVHDRFQGEVGSSVGPGTAGIGVSVVPERTLDLKSVLLQGDDVRLRHDLDRLAVTVYTPVADLTLGRQAVTWGNASLFPVADLWGRFSPFELDTQQKPGVDAVRALAYPGDGVEVDLVVADAGRDQGLSAAAHATFSRGWGDATLGAGKFWDEAILLVGATRVMETANLRLEAAVPWSLEEDRRLDPRITAGVDRIGVRWSWSAELHWNGLGSGDPEGYREILEGEALARGESYLLGRAYAGGLAAWTPDEEGRLRVALAVLGNLEDRSASVSPSASYDLGQSGRIILGGLIPTGAEPELQAQAGAPLPVIRLRSEFGSYGRLGYLQLALYF